ncbi:putative cytochrome P450 4d14-like Protein [Tribolium castaneum]|uniref:Putative cytochrome P450 4d14-like Protein n=1 Tax=Tribolium castaneum TaxID=7070 RepID=A0A139WIB4_TRICA|nr:putative cytochrome P450 4d14-like Protein [Tribolium castaneum]
MVTIFVICNTLLIIGGIILNLIPLSDDLHVYFALRFIHEYFPNHKTCLIILLKASIFPVIPHMLVVHAYQILYYTQHSNFQIQLFNKVIAEVDFWETPLRETELFYSKPYQKGIEKKLKFCIQRLQVLINAYIVKTKEIGTLIALFAICGVLMGIGFSLYLFSGKFTPEYYLRLTFMTLVAVTTFSSIIWGGQSTETIITEMITALCQVRWYNFSQTNKKLYLILLTNMMKDRKIKFTENYSINYQLGLAVLSDRQFAMFIFAALFFLIIFYLYHQNVKLNRILCTFPEPPKKFLLGHVLDITSTTDVLNVFSKYINNYGPTIKLRAATLFAGLGTTDYKLCELLLSNNRILSKSLNYQYARNWLGNGLLISDGDYWRRHRKILTPAFHFEILKQFVETFESVGKVFVEKLDISQGPSVDLPPLVTLCTLDVICETAMGTQINAQKGQNAKYVQSVREMCRILIDRGLSPLKILNNTYWMTKDYYIEKKSLKVLHSFTSSVIEKRKAERNERNCTKLAFLDLLLKFSNEGELLTDQELREEVDTFMFEGHDTTASSISFVLFCLANHPEVQEKVLREQNELFGDDKDPSVTYHELQKMKYLEQVIKETLRLYPAVPIIGRCTSEDITFGEHFIPKDTNIAIYIYGIHRNPEHFPEPETFNPDRFKNSNSLPPYAYIPFSAGPRNCIGQKFAMLEIKSIVSRVVRCFELRPAEPYHSLVLSAETVLKSANGIKIGIRKRI